MANTTYDCIANAWWQCHWSYGQLEAPKTFTTAIRQMTPLMLVGLQCEFTVDETPEQPLDFGFRRQMDEV